MIDTIDTAVILAGGLATRLRPITHSLPKALVPVAGRPFIEHQLALFKRNRIDRAVICAGYLGEQIEAALGDGSRYSMRIVYSYDGPQLLGTGGALRRAWEMLPATFWVLYGDSYLDFDYIAAGDFFQAQTGKLGLMTVFANQDRWDTSNVIYDNGALLKYDKHNRTPEMRYIDYGAAILKREALARLPTGERQADIAELYRGMVEEGLMAGYEVFRRFYEIGSPQGLAETDAYLRGKMEEESPQ